MKHKGVAVETTQAVTIYRNGRSMLIPEDRDVLVVVDENNLAIAIYNTRTWQNAYMVGDTSEPENAGLNYATKEQK